MIALLSISNLFCVEKSSDFQAALVSAAVRQIHFHNDFI